MNNIAQKNAIMRLQDNSGLPYSQPAHIAYESTTNISQASLNNTFAQLVDNDLYIENKLGNDYAYTIGPKPYNKDKIDAADNGYKTWGSFNSYELSILQKIEQSLQDSLTQALSTKCNFIIKYSGQLYVGTDDGLIFADNIDGVWRVLQSGKCNNYSYDEGNNVLLFAFEDGIYHLKLDEENKKKLVKITAGTFDCITVLFRPADCLLLISTSTNIYSGSYTAYYRPFGSLEDNFEIVKLSKVATYINNSLTIAKTSKTNVFEDVQTGTFPYKCSIFAGTENGLHQLSVINDFEDYQELPSGYSYTCAKAFNGKIFFGTETGLFKYNKEDETLIDTDINSNIEYIDIFANRMFVCAGGKLYSSRNGEEFVECQIEQNDIKKIAFIGTSSAYAYFILAGNSQICKILTGFNNNYDNLQTIYEGEIYDICTSPAQMTLCIAIKQANKRQIIEYKFPTITSIVSDELSTAMLETYNDLPAIATNSQTMNILKRIAGPNGKNYIVSERSICLEDDYSVSCQFINADGIAEKIIDAVVLSQKQAIVAMLENKSLSAVSLDLSDQNPGELFYIDPIVQSLQKFGCKGVYSYEEFGEQFVGVVTKQTDAAQQIDCQDVQNINSEKYFVAYVDTDGTGEECNFLKSPMVLDQASISCGVFTNPPALYAVDGKLLVLDKDNKKLHGFFQDKQQLIQSTSQSFVIPNSSEDTVKIYSVTTAENIILACATIIQQNGMQESGLYKSTIKSVTRVAANAYKPTYEIIDGKQSVLAVKGNINRVKVFGDKLFICSNFGLYQTTLDYISNNAPIDLTISDVVAGNEDFERLITNYTYDVAIVNDEDDNIIAILAATNAGIKVLQNQMQYSKDFSYNNIVAHIDFSYQPTEVSSWFKTVVVPSEINNQIAYSQFVACSNFDVVQQDQPQFNTLKCINYIINETGGSTTQVIDTGLAANIDNIVYCSKYRDEIDSLENSQDDFIAALRLYNNDLTSQAGGISAVFANSANGPTIKECVQSNSIIAIASSQYIGIDDGVVDGRFIVATAANSDLSVIHITDANSEPQISSLASIASSVSNITNIVAVGSKGEVILAGDDSSELVDTPVQSIYQVSNNKCRAIQIDIKKNASDFGYEYSNVVRNSKVSDLPNEIKNANWTKYNVCGDILYTLIDSNLYATNLSLVNINLKAIKLCDDATDVFFGYNGNVVVKHIDGTFSAVNSYIDEDSTNLLYPIEFKIGSTITTGIPVADATFVNSIGNFVFAGKYDHLNSGDCMCYTSAFSQKEAFVTKSLTNTSCTAMLYYDQYQSGNNNYNIYAIEDSTLNAYAYDLDIAKIVSTYPQIASNVKQILIKDYNIQLLQQSNNESKLQTLACNATTDNIAFSLQETIDFNSLMQTADQNLSNINVLIDVFGKTVTLQATDGATVKCNIINTVLQIRNDYNGQYIIATEDPTNIYVQISGNKYVTFTSLDNINFNEGIQLICNDATITDRKTLALAFQNNSVKWLNINNNIELSLTDINTVGWQTLSSIIILDGQPRFQELYSIACEISGTGFVHGTINDIDSWMYSNTIETCKLLDLEFKETDYSWINGAQKKVNDIFGNKKDLTFCTTAGLWKAAYDSNFIFNGQPSTTSLNQESENLLNPSGLDDEYIPFNISKLQCFRQSPCVAKAKMANGMYQLFKIDEIDDKLSAQQLSAGSTYDFKQVFAMTDAASISLLYVDMSDKLWQLNSRRNRYIDDLRQAANVVENATNVCMLSNLVTILGNSNQNQKMSFTYKSFNNDMACFVNNDVLSNCNVTLLRQLNKDQYIVGYNYTDEDDKDFIELAIIDLNELITTTVKTFETSGKAACSFIYKAQENDVQTPTYYFPIRNQILATNQPTSNVGWKEQYSIPNNAQVNGIYVDSLKNNYIATDTGLYYTYSKYTLENDIRKLTPNDVLNLFYDNISAVDDYYNSTIANHISKRHSPSSVITRLNNDMMDTQFSNISENWIEFDYGSTVYGETVIKNDLLYDIKFGEVNQAEEKYDDTIYVNTDNTVQNINNANLNYIMKRWMSGFTELYINIPTTGTYYLNHLLGTPNCTTNPNELIERRNLNQLSSVSIENRNINGQLSAHYTHIDLAIQAAEYNIDELLEVTINGNSLPLKIYRDNIDQHYDSASSRMYQSFVLPSIVETTAAQKQDDGYYHFHFACFGTDAQAIKISFVDKTNVYGNKFYTIQFNSNGGAGFMQPQKVLLDAEVQLKKNTTLYKDSSMFLGWSLKASVDGMSVPMFEDGQTISKDILENAVSNLKIQPQDTITLFAVWDSYEMPEDDSDYTTMTVKCNNGTQLSAVHQYDFAEGVKPIDTLVIDYGD